MVANLVQFGGALGCTEHGGRVHVQPGVVKVLYHDGILVTMGPRTPFVRLVTQDAAYRGIGSE